MSIHPESEQLSAFVDGELTEREQVAVEAHVASCAECRSLLFALRATVGDLSSLEPLDMDPRASWAIRKAVARERRLGLRSSRWAWAGGAAAASVVAILAFVLLAKGGGGSEDATGPGLAGAPVAGGDFNAQTAQLELDRLASGWAGIEAGTAEDAAGAPGLEAPMVQRNSAKSGAEAYGLSASPGSDQQARDDVARCERSIRRAGSDIERIRSIVGSYEGRAALLLFYQAPAGDPERIELWVVARDSCDVILFRQKQL